MSCWRPARCIVRMRIGCCPSRFCSSCSRGWVPMYDPFVRGPFPVGVRTAQAIDAVRDERPLTFEVWYPAGERYAGWDFAASSQDTFAVLPDLPPIRQAAVRDVAPHSGSYPLLAFSHSSWGHSRQSTFLCTHLAS